MIKRQNVSVISDSRRESGATVEVLVNGVIPVAWDERISSCAACKRKIGWGTTADGRKMPFDLGADKTSHFATCEFASRFKDPETMAEAPATQQPRSEPKPGPRDEYIPIPLPKDPSWRAPKP